ncbi:MAG TPA: sugar phosphate isomerase/epimerase family protein [Gemmataceae bacterium]|nr:sugar phosphate isomerase/epimerase family protein [Gemmataceae bacterium]
MGPKHLRIGVSLDSLGLSFRSGLEEIQRLSVAGVQVDAVGDLAPRALSQTGRREFTNLLRSHNLELAALGCPLRQGLDVAEGQQARIDHVKQVMSLSFDLGARLVLIQAGRIPEDLQSGRAGLLTEALLALGHHGDRTGTVLALETGLNAGKSVQEFLQRFDSGGLGVNFDPANLLINGFDPYESGQELQGRVVYAKAKDARLAGASRAGQEVALGNGDIDWMRLLSVLEEIDYRGWLTVERELGDDRRADVANGVGFLRRFIGPG